MAEPLPSAARDIVERVCLSFREWAPAESRPPRLLGSLPGGQSNLNLLLGGEQNAWVVRVPRDDRPDGVDYAREQLFHKLAAEHGLAPDLALAEPGSGLLVTAYVAPVDGIVAGRGSERSEGGSGDRDDTPEAVAWLLGAIHALDLEGLPASRREKADMQNDDGTAMDLSPLDTAAELDRLGRGPEPTYPLHDLPREARDHLQACVERSRERPARCVICHNDLLRSNRLAHGERLVAIDWEYARPGDPFFDLAVVASEFDRDQRAALLAAYLQRQPLAAEEQHLADQLVLYAAIATCWYARYGSTRATRMAIDDLLTRLRYATRCTGRSGE